MIYMLSCILSLPDPSLCVVARQELTKFVGGRYHAGGTILPRTRWTDCMYHLQILRPFQIFDRLVRRDDNGVAPCTIGKHDNCDSAAVGGEPTWNCRQCKVAPNVGLPANTDLVVLSPFELEVHWHSESKDSEKYDGPINSASVGQRWRIGEGYEWQLSVTAV